MCIRDSIQTHLSDRPFTCSYCPKSFVRQHDLNRHVKSHLVAKHCRCKCGKEFTRVEGYKRHLNKGICEKSSESEVGGSTKGVSKPSPIKLKRGEAVLDGLTSNRLHEDLGLAAQRRWRCISFSFSKHLLYFKPSFLFHFKRNYWHFILSRVTFAIAWTL